MNLPGFIAEPLRRIDLERFTALRPKYPPVAVEVDRGEMVLVRLRRRRRGRHVLEAHEVRPMPPNGVGASILRPNLGSPEEVAGRMRELFERSGTRPGKVSLVLPDNLAKVSLMTFPERPASRRQLGEILRFKLRRSVPFRLEEAAISYQILPGDGKELNVLVALMLRSVVEQYERVVELTGARPGLVDLSTLCLYNLCRPQLAIASAGGLDAALVNCAVGYFSLMIVRGGRVLFYRCKSYAQAEDESRAPEAVMARELATSLSYYQEKLGGQGIETTIVRSVASPLPEVTELLERVGFGGIEAVNPAAALGSPRGAPLDPAVGQRIASAVGAASGRGD